jgi:hypothetical protein
LWVPLAFVIPEPPTLLRLLNVQTN